ncbi:MAG: NFACT RNA binding domain-containing protein [Candidatus Micrarchaeales archaeon]
MDIEIDLSLSAQENANEYFSKAKRARKKMEGAEQSIKELEKKLEVAKDRYDRKSATKKTKMVTKKEWYEKFHWFMESSGMLAIGGKDAVQNELINSKYFEDQDLFFHADIFGASVVVLKGGIDSGKEAREEAAQFAACYSSAWKQGLAAVDVYCMKREQISKSSNKGSLGTGSFAMKGEREWFRSMKLELVAFVTEKEGGEGSIRQLSVVPSSTFAAQKGKKGLRITIGNAKKSDAAKLIAKKLDYEDIDYIMQQLPAGEFKISE